MSSLNWISQEVDHLTGGVTCRHGNSYRTCCIADI